MNRKLRAAAFATALLTVLVALAPRALPAVAASLVVDRVPLPLRATPTLPYQPFRFRSGDATMDGWLFRPAGPPRGLVIHLHGRMYSRIGGIATAEALVPRGYAVLAYDLRAHGRSGGDHATYGLLESHDLARAIDAVGISPVYVVGHSMGAAVALRAAAEDPRIRAVVAASCFTDLSTAVAERADSMLLRGEGQLRAAVRLAEARAGFRFDQVSPLRDAARVQAPVLLVHGALDASTPPRHSQRLFDALPGKKRLYVVEGAAHTDVLDDSKAPVWSEIIGFLQEVGAAPRPPVA